MDARLGALRHDHYTLQQWYHVAGELCRRIGKGEIRALHFEINCIPSKMGWPVHSAGSGEALYDMSGRLRWSMLSFLDKSVFPFPCPVTAGCFPVECGGEKALPMRRSCETLFRRLTGQWSPAQRTRLRSGPARQPVRRYLRIIRTE